MAYESMRWPGWPSVQNSMSELLWRRAKQIRRILKVQGLAGLQHRGRSALATWLAPATVQLPLREADVTAADLTNPFQPPIPPILPGEPIIVNWVVTPAAPGSGGHTTLYRIANYLQAHGYHNRVYFHDMHLVDLAHYERILRSAYGFTGEVSNMPDDMQDAHAVVATAWPTAYTVYNARCAGKRFYFVQDFEPWFHPVGALSALAENTYRMGFHAITAGCWLSNKLCSEYGMQVDSFEFGCDTARYTRRSEKRHGIAYYARPDTPRRGHEIGLMTLQLLTKRLPDVEIHVYGEKMGAASLRCVDHGRVTPDQLNDIYNCCFAGLSLSLTNVSLVPHEMLATGCIPVVNDAQHNRMVLRNSFVEYAPLNPPALAEALIRIATRRDFDAYAEQASLSVHGCSWDDAGVAVDAALKRALSVAA